MKVGYKKLGLVLGAVAAFALMPVRADAQFVSYSPIFWSFEGGAGIAIPMGDLSDNTSSGISLWIGGAYFLNPRFALRVELSVSVLAVWALLGAVTSARLLVDISPAREHRPPTLFPLV